MSKADWREPQNHTVNRAVVGMTRWPAVCCQFCDSWDKGGGPNMSPSEVHALAFRVRAEFLEMPGLRLTLPQASRLWGLELPACRDVIEVLVRSAFLRWTAAGAVARVEA